MKRGAIEDARDFIRSACPATPDCVMVLGSGLGRMADAAADLSIVDYAAIPGFPVPTVEGHRGRLVTGKLSGKNCAILQGRFHCYEGLTAAEVAFPVRVLLGMGQPFLLVTNAAGAVNTRFAAGDIMLIRDHINLTGQNPLTGPNDPALGPRFPDMGAAYSERLVRAARDAAGACGIGLREGVYAGVNGPSYETPAEIGMLRALGADAVGMSTVHEVIAARHMGAEVLGISCISNAAAGTAHGGLDHVAVQEAADRASETMIALIKAVLERLRHGT